MNDKSTSSPFLGGLQAGMAGALVMLGWMGITMLWSRHSVWWFPNLMATTFGGDGALRTGFGKLSAAGLALHLTQYSLLGALFSSVVPVRLPRTRLLLFGVVAAVGYYYLMYDWVWRRVNPLIPLYSPDRPILIAHILFGFMLARLPHYVSARVPATEYSGRS